MFRFLIIALFLAGATSTKIVASSKQLRRNAGASFISSLQFKYVLRICNAYPYTYPMDVFVGKEKLTESSIPYKNCAEFTPDLKVGDKLDFKVSDSSAGSFTISELPSNDAIMVLIVYRHDTRSTAVSFESHVFSNLLNAQVAVLDTYRGAAKAVPKIQDVSEHVDKNEVRRSEELRYNSVVAVNQGLYEVVLHAPDGENKARHQFVALNRESYMVMRVGVESEEGQAFPQELMVFPMSDPRQLSGAARSSMFAAVFVALVALLQ